MIENKTFYGAIVRLLRDSITSNPFYLRDLKGIEAFDMNDFIATVNPSDDEILRVELWREEALENKIISENDVSYSLSADKLDPILLSLGFKKKAEFTFLGRESDGSKKERLMLWHHENNLLIAVSTYSGFSRPPSINSIYIYYSAEIRSFGLAGMGRTKLGTSSFSDLNGKNPWSRDSETGEAVFSSDVAILNGYCDLRDGVRPVFHRLCSISKRFLDQWPTKLGLYPLKDWMNTDFNVVVQRYNSLPDELKKLIGKPENS